MKRPLKRVAVTGIGMVTSLGEDTERTWDGIVAGRTGIGDRVPWEASRYATRLVGAVDDAALKGHLSAKEWRRLDRCNQLSVVGARAALVDGGLASGTFDPARAGIFLGSSLGGMLSGMRYYQDKLARGARRSPWLYRYPFHVCLDTLFAATGFAGPGSLVATACTASTIAVAQGLEAIRNGSADVVLTGGVDPLCEFSFSGFSAMQNVSAQPCAPFSEPPGLTLGEGATFLILEEMERATKRGATILAECRGYSLSADAYHPTAPDPSGSSQRRLLADALKAAGLTPADLNYVNAHGTGTLPNDATESRAIANVMGEFAGSVAVSSTKGATGHMLGAAGAFEAAATVLAVARGVLPPTANFTTARADCDLDYVPNKGRPADITFAASENFAFGGNNAALVIGRADAAPPPLEIDDHQPVITGFGVISPTGIGRDAFGTALQGVQSGIGVPQGMDLSGLAVRLAAVVDDFQPSKLTRTNVRRADRVGQFTVCATELALADAGLRITKENTERVGICLGTGRGPVESCRAFYHDIALGRPDAVNPKIFPNTVLNAGAGLAAVNFRLKGCNVATTVGVASGLQAIALAADLIRAGKADAIIAGGCDELSPEVIEGYAVARQLSPLAGSPGQDEGLWLHDKRRNGMVLGEGCGFVVIESRRFAEARGATPIAEIVATAIAGSPDRSGSSVGRTMAHCLGAAPMVDLVLSGAIGLARTDAAEAAAIAEQFKNGPTPAIAALGSLFGISGATPALSLCAGLVGMQSGFFPAGQARSEPVDGLAMIEGAPRQAPLGSVLVNGLSEGGLSVSVLLRSMVKG